MALKPYSAPGFLPADNPLSQWVSPRRNALLGFGAGMLSNNWSDIGTSTMQGMALDRDYAMEAEQKAQEEASKNATIEWLQSQGYNDLVQMAQATGDIGAAWSEGLKRKQPKAAQAPMEINGQLVDPVTYEVLGDFRDPQSGLPAAPSGYQWNPDGTQSYIPGGPADPANQGKTTEAQRRNQQLASVIQPELAAVEQNWSELASPANQAAGVEVFGNQPGYGLTSPGYQQATNALTTIAQSYLYSVSGAAATDAEVKKIVDSVTPKPFESQQSIDAKLARIRQMAAAVIQAGGANQPQPASGGTLSNGVQWSIGQ